MSAAAWGRTMILFIGGYAQGKYEAASKLHPGLPVLDGGKEDLPGKNEELIFKDLHLWWRRKFMEGKEPTEEASGIFTENSSFIITADEIGCGLVPLDKEEREYRDSYGRFLQELARRAEKVIRVTCGITERIK